MKTNNVSSKISPKIIFFGNGPLADCAKLTLIRYGFDIVFHARTKEDLEEVKRAKAEMPEAHGVLASFGVMIKSDVLDLFEPEGILNIHPSKLPDLRGPSPIETAILRGDNEFSVSVMKLVKEMDAGPIYFQKTLTNAEIIEKTEWILSNQEPGVVKNTDGTDVKNTQKSLPSKADIYLALSVTGTEWIAENLENLGKPREQDPSKKPTFSKKLETNMSEIKPSEKTAEQVLNEIRAFERFPKSRYTFFGVDCIIHKAHVSKNEEILSLKCMDNTYICIDELQPANKKKMDAKSFLNGYKK
ncbi:MAG: formyltransferase family protein [Candidatus Saccharibacteria bacterium]|nr:formyltransferase family protein [Candidatus Saccharibacteria bacterium]